MERLSNILIEDYDQTGFELAKFALFKLYLELVEEPEYVIEEILNDSSKIEFHIQKAKEEARISMKNDAEIIKNEAERFFDRVVDIQDKESFLRFLMDCEQELQKEIIFN